MAQHSLKEKIVLLTGAGGGIGRAVAERLAGEGMKIILLGGNNREKLFSTQQAIEKYAPPYELIYFCGIVMSQLIFILSLNFP